jgi:DNA-binding response OmpR family regulator
MNILLLEDDFTLSKEIKLFLDNNSFECDCVYDGSLLLKQYRLKKYDIILLDINVPSLNGLKVCQSIREEDKKTPILMLTAFGEIEDKLTAFDKGADDYLVKPFHFEELLARVKSLLRRKETPQAADQILKIADLTINVVEMKVFRAEKEINLSPKEYKLLNILANANGRIVGKQYISDQLWDYHIETNQNTIEVYINFLRKKIDKDFEPKLIHTKVGYGYFLKDISLEHE